MLSTCDCVLKELTGWVPKQGCCKAGEERKSLLLLKGRQLVMVGLMEEAAVLKHGEGGKHKKGQEVGFGCVQSQ